MHIIIDAKRWPTPIDSKEIEVGKTVRELRLVQREDGYIVVFMNGDPEPKIALEPMYNGGGERLFVFGDHEDVAATNPDLLRTDFLPVED
jgi:Trk K+ transport system NAD-binding subunit